MIRQYSRADKEQLTALLRRNIPEYFHPGELKDYDEYLDLHLEKYFVYEVENDILGCGGINYSDDRQTARLSWDIVHPKHHRKGIGKKLLEHRVSLLKSDPDLRQIAVRTTQHAYKFYEQNGFTLVRTEKDFWAKGFDLYFMHMPVLSF
ncbi:MAG: GNAT family N-acetyltransferase [Bacteroidetes bacterium]|nr:GNAT family N-acetyltransferase [Bacteroidota bacterium]